MTFYCKLCIKLEVLTPFLCGATGPSQWGIDASFQRNFKEQPIIPWSHLKGKLREAWMEIGDEIFGSDKKQCIDGYLGQESMNGDYLPNKSPLIFSDFVYQDDGFTPDRLHRIRLDRTTGTADEGALVCIETLHPSGETTFWQGDICFPAESKKKAKEIEENVLLGLRWISALGAEKGVGFGRMVKVNLADKAEISDSLDFKPQTANMINGLGLTIQPEDPLVLGGVRRKDNYFESETIITGGVIKGALAQALRRRLRPNDNDNDPIQPGKEFEDAGLPRLAKYFEQIRFTHARPTKNSSLRPVKPPISLVKGKRNGQDFFDVAREIDDSKLDDNQQSPTFFIDWKGEDFWKVDKAYGWASPKPIARTRTAIDVLSRTAKEEKLYTYQYICPIDDDGDKLNWLSNIYLPAGIPDDDRSGLAAELKFVLENWLERLGKRDGQVKAICADKHWEPFVVGNGPLVDQDGLSIITLQSDALMLDPWKWEKNAPDRKSLLDAYRTYWSDISDQVFYLERFFAAQRLVGGYLGLRFKVDGKYYPFFLTSAGSVFVLTCQDKQQTKKLVDEWLSQGLPTPGWALEKYGKRGNERLDWAKCPFTPENGYGEIAVNLPISSCL